MSRHKPLFLTNGLLRLYIKIQECWFLQKLFLPIVKSEGKITERDFSRSCFRSIKRGGNFFSQERELKTDFRATESRDVYLR